MRARHPLTVAEEHQYLLAGSRLFNAGSFFETHEEWEEVWRRASGPRRELLRGLIQISVGYEHLKRGNITGAISLLSQGVRRLRYHTPKAGVRDLRLKARHDAASLARHDLDVTAPKVWVCIASQDRKPPADAIVVDIPPA